MTRELGIPAAVVAVVTFPLLVFAAGKDNTASVPDPSKAALTINLAGSAGSSKDPVFVRLTAVGAQPPVGKRFTLTDATGTHSAKVSGSDAAACQNATVRTTGLEGEKNEKVWCLRLTAVDVGAQLDGTVAGAAAGVGPSTQLALTVTRRNAFLWLPLFTLAAGLLAGLLVILVPRGLSRFVKQVVLSDMLDANNAASPEKHIGGLDSWVTERLENGAQEDELANEIAPVIRRGPARAAESRAKLLHAIDESGIPTDFAILEGARREANKTTHEISDFLDEDGKASIHPATTWLSALQAVDDARAFIATASDRIGQLRPACQAVPTEERDQALQALRQVTKPADTAGIAERLDDLRTAVEDAEAEPDCITKSVAAAATVYPLELAPAAAPETVNIAQIQLGASRGAKPLAVLATIVVLLVIVSFAALTVALSAYDSKQTFASATDYFTLFSAALGSGAAVSVVAALGWWKVTSGSDGK
jgi:hypothetical protein